MPLDVCPSLCLIFVSAYTESFIKKIQPRRRQTQHIQLQRTSRTMKLSTTAVILTSLAGSVNAFSPAPLSTSRSSTSLAFFGNNKSKATSKTSPLTDEALAIYKQKYPGTNTASKDSLLFLLFICHLYMFLQATSCVTLRCICNFKHSRCEISTPSSNRKLLL